MSACLASSCLAASCSPAGADMSLLQHSSLLLLLPPSESSSRRSGTEDRGGVSGDIWRCCSCSTTVFGECGKPPLLQVPGNVCCTGLSIVEEGCRCAALHDWLMLSVVRSCCCGKLCNVAVILSTFRHKTLNSCTVGSERYRRLVSRVWNMKCYCFAVNRLAQLQKCLWGAIMDFKCQKAFNAAPRRSLPAASQFVVATGVSFLTVSCVPL